jgi:hypothetical protein
MAFFKTNFKTSMETSKSVTRYVLIVTVGLEGPNPYGFIDEDTLLIQRKDVAGNAIDVFKGVIRAPDFKLLARRQPSEGKDHYRTNTWTLIVYNQQTLDEIIETIKKHMDILADEVTIEYNSDRHRTVTHISEI